MVSGHMTLVLDHVTMVSDYVVFINHLVIDHVTDNNNNMNIDIFDLNKF